MADEVRDCEGCKWFKIYINRFPCNRCNRVVDKTEIKDRYVKE